MSERTWLLRDAVTRIIADAPLPPATWPSVIRRTAIVVGLVVVGMVSGNPQAGLLAAFGAVQLGLIEAAVPLRSLIRLQALLIIACMATVYAAMVLGGTWWLVPFLALLAYLFGATAALSPAAMTVGISTLALTVIFAGMPHSQDEALRNTVYIGIGLLTQAIGWLIAWRAERTLFLRHALANKIRGDVRLLRASDIDVPTLVRAHAQTDAAVRAISLAGLAPADDTRFRQALSVITSTTRALIAWLVLQAPGEADRIAVGLELQAQARRLGLRSSGPTPSAVIPGQTVSVRGLRESLDRLSQAITDLLDGASPSDTPITGPAATQTPNPKVTWARIRQALLPNGRLSRHGMRMLVGITVAEAISLSFPLEHSFWLPLTVVFTLRPDWTFTVIRGLNRTVGNLAAVIFLPAVFFLFGASTWTLLIPLTILAAVAFRWLFGNYAIASFGLAGSVLVLDYALDPGTNLLLVRVLAAFFGSLLSIAVALAIPTWSSTTGPAQAAALIASVRRWREDVTTRLRTGAGVEDAVLEADIAAAREALLALDPTATGALLEPRRQGRAIELALLMATGVREVGALLAGTYVTIMAPDLPTPRGERVIERARLPECAGAFDRAVEAYQR